MYLQCGPAWRGVFKDCLWCRSNTLVSSVIVHLLHPFRVCFSAPPTLCSVDTAESDLDEEEVVNTDISTEEKEQQKVIFSTRFECNFHIFPTRSECNFLSSPLVPSVIFSSSPLVSSVILTSSPLVSSVVLCVHSDWWKLWGGRWSESRFLAGHVFSTQNEWRSCKPEAQPWKEHWVRKYKFWF